VYLLPPSLWSSPEYEATTRECGGGEERAAEPEEKRAALLTLLLPFPRPLPLLKPAAPAESTLTSLSDAASEAPDEEREKRAAQREATVEALCC